MMFGRAFRNDEMDALRERWHAAWPAALDCWSHYTRLHKPELCSTTREAKKEGLAGSFAMIRFADQRVVVDLQAIGACGLQDYAVEILAHEIGHHVQAPGSALDHLRMLARIRRVLGTVAAAAPMVANLYTDLCINDRLQRQCKLRMDAIYRVLAQHHGDKEDKEDKARPSRVWTLYLRTYEHLWQLDQGRLGGGQCDDALDGDAWLGAQVVRVYANEPMIGAARFAALLLPYLVADQEQERQDTLAQARQWHDTKDAATDYLPSGMQELEDDELDDALHPVHDPRVTGAMDADRTPTAPGNRAAGQAREPYEYGEILKAGGVKLTPHQIAMRYYRERAQPHLVPFPTRPDPRAAEPEFEGVEPWSLGDPLDEIDWLHSVSVSPRPIPGLSLVRRVFSQEQGHERAPLPVDLDLYVDSSGSMPDPQHSTSYLALAGAIVALSALRAGAAVQVTLWSGKGDLMTTAGFTRDADDVMRVLTGYIGGGTCFPIHRLRETYAARPPERSTHILMISDDGITTMFDKDERGNSGWDVAARALAAGAAGGTMALNLPADWDGSAQDYLGQIGATLRRARDEQGWDVLAVPDMPGLVAFAQAFSRRHYAPGGAKGTR